MFCSKEKEKKREKPIFKARAMHASIMTGEGKNTKICSKFIHIGRQIKFVLSIWIQTVFGTNSKGKRAHLMMFHTKPTSNLQSMWAPFPPISLISINSCPMPSYILYFMVMRPNKFCNKLNLFLFQIYFCGSWRINFGRQQKIDPYIYIHIFQNRKNYKCQQLVNMIRKWNMPWAWAPPLLALHAYGD